MASETANEETNKGNMWDLDQNLDQPMDEEAGRLKNMYREKVRFNLSFGHPLIIYSIFLFLFAIRCCLLIQ